MIEMREIETAPGLVFDCSVSGDASAPLVLMLHGFCVSRYFWDNQIPVLAAAGYFAVAPNQRGYAAGARPDPANFDNYRIDKLIGDAQDIVPVCRVFGTCDIRQMQTRGSAHPLHADGTSPWAWIRRRRRPIWSSRRRP